MSIWYVPSSFNFQEHDGLRELLGDSFVEYYVKDYSGHERVRAELRGDQRDARIMQVCEEIGAKQKRREAVYEKLKRFAP